MKEEMPSFRNLKSINHTWKTTERKGCWNLLFYIYSKIQTCLIQYYHYTACWLQPWSETLLGLQRLSSPLSLREVFPKRKLKLAKYWIAKAVQSIFTREVFPKIKWKLAKYAKYLDFKGCTVHCHFDLNINDHAQKCSTSLCYISLFFGCWNIYISTYMQMTV